MPARTMFVTPRSASSARSASISGTSGRETETACSQPSRCAASASASGPHRVASPAVMPEATQVGDPPRQGLLGDGLDVARQVDVGVIARSRRRRGASAVRLEVVPRGDELVDALVLQHLGDVGEVDAEPPARRSNTLCAARTRR